MATKFSMRCPALMRRLAWLALPLLFALASCGQSQGVSRTGVGLTGIDHLADHLSVQEFSVNGTSGAQAGKGGRVVCCVSLPDQWQPGMTVKVRWNVTNWRDCKGEEHEAVVPVEKYEEVGDLQVHFFPNNKVRVVSSIYAPWSGPMPGSKYPIKDPIPQKEPWKIYPPHEHCKESFE